MPGVPQGSYREEAVSVAAAMALHPTDMLFPSYRNQGLDITRGMTPAPRVDLRRLTHPT